MKILYVGDGRCRDNWGARATSEALHDLIAKNHTISGIIDSTAKDKTYVRLFFNNILSPRAARAIGHRNKKPIFRVLSKLFPLKQDYVDDITNNSVKAFLRLKSFYPKLNDIYSKVLSADAIVLNGEGSFIFKTPPRRDALFFLFIMKLAKDLGKKTYCLNAMISDCPVTGRNEITVRETIRVFKEADDISLRDPFSYSLLKEIAPDLKNTKYRVDALFSWYDLINEMKATPLIDIEIPKANTNFPIPDFDKPYICISGSSLAAWDKEQAVQGYVALINKLKKLDIPLLIVPTCKGDIFLDKVSKATGVPILPVFIDVKIGARILGAAKVFISGRFHPSILASLGSTPCVFMGSNSHKTLSLQTVLEYPNPVEYNAVPTANDIEKIFIQVQEILAEGEARRFQINKTVSRLSEEAKEVSYAIK